jgi:hypothetical protein
MYLASDQRGSIAVSWSKGSFESFCSMNVFLTLPKREQNSNENWLNIAVHVAKRFVEIRTSSKLFDDFMKYSKVSTINTTCIATTP